MKIVIMMRAIDQDSGFHLYIDGLVEALSDLAIPGVSFILFYRSLKWFGRFSNYKNITEYHVKAPNKFIWDQVAVPLAARKHKADIIFNPKFTVPLFSPCPSVMGLQEPAWFVWPSHYPKSDVRYQKIMLPLYIRKASHLFPMASWVIDENRKYIKASFDKCTVTNPGVHKHLKPVEDKKILYDFRIKYNLPEKFILSMTRVDNPGLNKSHKWNPSKNPHTTLKAFILCKDKVKHDLVFAGRNVKQYLIEHGFNEKDFERVHFINFIPFNEIQNIFTLADLIVVPAFYESFGFTLLGAIACGCPAVASNKGACLEVLGNAGLYATPYSAEDFAEKILKVLENEEFRIELKRKSLIRSRQFTWERTAQLTMKGIEEAVNTNFRKKKLKHQKGSLKIKKAHT